MAGMPSRALPQLLPAPPGARRQATTKPKKPQTSAACSNCRARKTKVSRGRFQGPLPPTNFSSAMEDVQDALNVSQKTFLVSTLRQSRVK